MSDAIAALALKALDGLDLRTKAIAQNIANAATPGYRSLRVTFEEELRAAALRGGDGSEVQPKLAFAPYVAGEDGVRLDLELASTSLTSGRYGALVEVLGRRMQLTALAIKGDR